jgi:hypothetical protein
MMKKVFFAFAIAGMFGFAACNNNNTPAEDTTAQAAVEELVAEPEMTDSTAVEGMVEEVAAEAAETVAE